MKSVYLDNCCLNRPFDDQAQPRIRLEAEAVELVLGLVQQKLLTLVTSDASIAENNRCRDADKQRQVACLMQLAGRRLRADASVIARAEQLAELGFGTFDALHVSTDESSGFFARFCLFCDGHKLFWKKSSQVFFFLIF